MMSAISTAGGISRERVELGHWVYSAWKHLRSYRQTDVASFEATTLAGKACDLLGRMRQLSPYQLPALHPLIRDAGISRLEFTNTILPILEALGILQVARLGNAVHTVLAQVLSQTDVMDQTGRCWEHLDPDAVERGALFLLRRTADLPMTREEASGFLVMQNLTDEEAARAIEMAVSVELVRVRHIADLSADFIYNDFLWGEDIDRTTKALAAVKPAVRTSLRSLFEELHKHEGRPTAEIESAEPALVDMAIAQGLIEATEITTKDGKTARFHFTPRFRGYGVSQDEVPDELDQVKLVVASFAFSTRYAKWKLRDPDQFLGALIDRGYAGNATPIGTDYGSMERQKIVNVEPTSAGSGRYRFIAVKRDTLIEARDTMRAGMLLSFGPSGSGSALLKEPYAFTDPIRTRQRARETAPRPLYDADLLAAVREAAQREGFR
jgi:hypothetical protein